MQENLKKELENWIYISNLIKEIELLLFYEFNYFMNHIGIAQYFSMT